jgi:hypothetical protein
MNTESLTAELLALRHHVQELEDRQGYKEELPTPEDDDIDNLYNIVEALLHLLTSALADEFRPDLAMLRRQLTEDPF